MSKKNPDNSNNSNQTSRRHFLKTGSAVVAMLSCNSESSGQTEQKKQETTETPQTKPVVYKTNNITSDGLMAVYKALKRELPGKVAVKISTGEPGGHNFLSPDLIKNLVQSVKGTIVECNTAYPGKRTGSESHKKAAKDHGFTAIAPVDIMDEDGSIELPFDKGKHIKKNFVGSHFSNYDSFLILSHFKGHAVAGFGGAIKNISIGIASSAGKMWIHTAGATDKTSDFEKIFTVPQNDFQESMADATGAVLNKLGDRILYINVMNKLSIDCDCDFHPASADSSQKRPVSEPFNIIIFQFGDVINHLS
jgi:uncharacterized Fe-S center protein